MPILVDNVKIRYTDLEKRFPDWISIRLYLPFPYDLVIVQTACKREILAWFNGDSWDGYKLKKTYVILRWKRSFREDRYVRQTK